MRDSQGDGSEEKMKQQTEGSVIVMNDGWMVVQGKSST